MSREKRKRNKKVRNMNILRFIVGPETGYTGEGNTQWYYIVALAISVMITWMTAPQIAIHYTVIAGLHLFGVVFYAYTITREATLYKTKKTFVTTMVYCALQIVLISVAITLSFWRGIIFTILAIILYLIAPDEFGNNIFYREDKDMSNSSIPLVFNCIAFFALIAIIINLPVGIIAKILIIVGFMILHYIVDRLAVEHINIKEVSSDVYTVLEDMCYNYKDDSKRKENTDDLFSVDNDFEEKVDENPTTPDKEAEGKRNPKPEKQDDSQEKPKFRRSKKAEDIPKKNSSQNPYNRHTFAYDLDVDDDSSESDDMEEPNE